MLTKVLCCPIVQFNACCDIEGGVERLPMFSISCKLLPHGVQSLEWDDPEELIGPHHVFSRFAVHLVDVIRSQTLDQLHNLGERSIRRYMM